MATTPRHLGATGIRVTALAGAVFFVLVLVQAQLTTGSPTATDPGRDVLTFVADHQSRLQLAAALLGLAMPAALVLLAGLSQALDNADDPTARLTTRLVMAGGALAAAATVAAALELGVVATRVAELTPATARVWWTLHLLGYGGILTGLVLVTGATAVTALRTRLFPRWFAVASGVLAILSLVGALTIGYDAAGLQVVAVVAVLLDSVWILLVGWYLWRDPARALP